MSLRHALVLVVVWTVSIGANAIAQDKETVTALHDLFADEWAFRLQEDPLFATAVGDHRYNDKLPSATPADAERRIEKKRGFL